MYNSDELKLITESNKTYYFLKNVYYQVEVRDDGKELYIMFPTPGGLGKKFITDLPKIITKKLATVKTIETIHIDLRGNLGGIPFVFVASLISTIVMKNDGEEDKKTMLWGVSRLDHIPILRVEKNSIMLTKPVSGKEETYKLNFPIRWSGETKKSSKDTKPYNFKVSVSETSQSSSQMIAIILRNEGAEIIGDAPVDASTVPCWIGDGMRAPLYRFADREGNVYKGLTKAKSIHDFMVEMPSDIELLKDSIVCEKVDNPIRLPVVSKFHRFVQERYNISQPSNVHMTDDFLLKKDHPAFKDGVLHIINPNGYQSKHDTDCISVFNKKHTIEIAYKDAWNDLEKWVTENPDKPVYLDARGYKEYGTGAYMTFYPFLDNTYTHDGYKFPIPPDSEKPILVKAQYILVVDEFFGKYNDYLIHLIFNYFKEHHKIDGRPRHDFTKVLTKKNMKIGNHIIPVLS